MGNTGSSDVLPGNVGAEETGPDGVVGAGVVVQPATSSIQTVIARIAMFFNISPSYGTLLRYYGKTFR
jgi:hypothetical protein